MQTLTLGYSPCPNDTFIFYAMVHGKVDTGGVKFKEVLLDVETLNKMSLRTGLDITKVSFHSFGHLRKKYTLLRAGGAMGRGCGPLVIARNQYTMDDLRGKRIAIPGRLTTACLLLQLFDPSFRHDASSLMVMPFHKIMDSVASGDVDAGLIIHESRFTYPSYGLREIIDLGAWWEDETGLPIPLGGIIAKLSLGDTMHKKANEVIRRSIQYAFDHPAEPLNYIKQHAQELSDNVILQHIKLYVNDFTLDPGQEGERAVTELISRSEEAGIIPRAHGKIFI